MTKTSCTFFTALLSRSAVENQELLQSCKICAGKCGGHGLTCSHAYCVSCQSYDALQALPGRQSPDEVHMGPEACDGPMSHHVPLCLLDGLPIVSGLQLGQEVLLVLDLQQCR